MIETVRGAIGADLPLMSLAFKISSWTFVIISYFQRTNLYSSNYLLRNHFHSLSVQYSSNLESKMSVTNPEHIKITVRDTGVAIIQLNRPEKRNAFNQSMIVGLAATLSKLNSDDAVRAVVLTGGPNGPFCGEYLSEAFN